MYNLEHVSESGDLDSKYVFDLAGKHMDSGARGESAHQRVRHVGRHEPETEYPE